MKVVINSCFGGFNLSAKAKEYYGKLNGIKELFHYLRNYEEECYKKVSVEELDGSIIMFTFSTTKDFGDVVPVGSEMELLDHSYSPNFDNDRHNPHLIQTVEELGELASSRVSDLNIIEIPDDVEYEIKEYDGNEWVAEKHRTWR